MFEKDCRSSRDAALELAVGVCALSADLGRAAMGRFTFAEPAELLEDWSLAVRPAGCLLVGVAPPVPSPTSSNGIEAHF